MRDGLKGSIILQFSWVSGGDSAAACCCCCFALLTLCLKRKLGLVGALIRNKKIGGERAH